MFVVVHSQEGGTGEVKKRIYLIAKSQSFIAPKLQQNENNMKMIRIPLPYRCTDHNLSAFWVLFMIFCVLNFQDL